MQRHEPWSQRSHTNIRCSEEQDSFTVDASGLGAAQIALSRAGEARPFPPFSPLSLGPCTLDRQLSEESPDVKAREANT